jgi:hypothetical protein
VLQLQSGAAAAMEQFAAIEPPISLEDGHQNYCARKNTETKTDPLTSSFWNSKNSKLTSIADLHPGDWECTRVLRPLWTELPAQTVRVYPL